jgi:GT2 family glycosyltransferase
MPVAIQENKEFAGFIITYERAEIIGETIRKIFEQTLPPEKILIVDNSVSDTTEKVVVGLNDTRLAYHRMGYNAGPAGAAAFALKQLANEGYPWIAWCDDDDPPKFNDSFEKVLGSARNGESIGIAGAVGSRFNWSTGMLYRLNDEELKGQVPVDSIAGGMVMIIQSRIIKYGIWPDEDLFFGFEELDFCLRTKQAGFEIVVNGGMALRYRQEAGRMNITTRKDLYRGWKFRKTKHSMWREYYSIRNFCYLMLYKYRRPRLVFILLLRVLYKMVTGFRIHGRYGWLHCQILFSALKDAYLKRMGRNDQIPEMLNK